MTNEDGAVVGVSILAMIAFSLFLAGFIAGGKTSMVVVDTSGRVCAEVK